MNELFLRGALAVMLFGGCGSEVVPDLVVQPGGPEEPEAPEAPAGPNVNVLDFGATGDDETDDTQAFRDAINALPSTGGTVIVPAGVFMLTAVDLSPNRAIDLSGKRDITLTGSGATVTHLRMAPGTYQGATHMVLVRDASGITIEKLTLDGNRARVIYRDEQSHGIQIMSSTNTRIREMTFQNMGGDGIRLFGAAEAGQPWTERVWIEDSRFQDTTRNGISLQRAARFVEIRRNTFDRISDQSISSEPSGAGAPQDIVIEDNIVRHSTGAFAIALSGIKTSDVLQRMTFRNNRIENGAAYFLWTDGLIVENNVIQGDRLHSALRLHDVSGALVVDNEISGVGEGGGGIVRITNYDNSLPSEVTVARNTIRPAPGLSALYVRDARANIEIRENTIIGDDGNQGIEFNNVNVYGTPRTAFSIVGNEIRNFAVSISFATRGDAYREVEIRDNLLDHDQLPSVETIGILFRETGPFQAFASILSNDYGAGIRTEIEVRGQ